MVDGWKNYAVEEHAADAVESTKNAQENDIFHGHEFNFSLFVLSFCIDVISMPTASMNEIENFGHACFFVESIFFGSRSVYLSVCPSVCEKKTIPKFARAQRIYDIGSSQQPAR